MFRSLFTAASAIVLTTSIASAQSLLLNFHSTNAGDDGPVAAPYLTLDPAHNAGSVPSGDTTWNNFNTAASSSSLSYADGSAATGVSITFGNGTAAGGTAVDYTTTAGIRTNVALGTGGGLTGQQSLLAADSIYGPNNSPAMARQGWLGNDNVAIGMRIDGLSAGSYTVYVLSRNTNSNVASAPLTIYATTGVLSSTFDFSSLSGTVQANTGYASAGYAGQYTIFTEGENYVAINFTVATGESLFIASYGTGESNARGVFNGAQIVAVPEPRALSLIVAGGLGLLLLFRRRRVA